jgi:hypothetical protein
MKKELKQKIRKAFIPLLLICLFGFAIIVYKMISNWPVLSNTPIKEYNSLFTKEALNKLKIFENIISKNRPAISSYIYDKTYSITVTKVDLTKSSTLVNMIDYRNGISNKFLNAVYTDLPSTFDLSINTDKPTNVSTIHFKSDGDTIKLVVKTDSIYCYYYKFKTFSITYNNEVYDIVGIADESNTPASLAFVKKNNELYVILMFVKEGEERMKENQLFSILK